MSTLTVADLLIGVGGLSLGLERAGFEVVLGIDNDLDAISSVQLNRPRWATAHQDIGAVKANDIVGVDVVAAALPSPGAGSETHEVSRHVLRVITELKPAAALLEVTPAYRRRENRTAWEALFVDLNDAGFQTEAQVVLASDFGVPQRRPRIYVVALQPTSFRTFSWPYPGQVVATVGRTLEGQMASRGWRGAALWAEHALSIGPTIVGGSRRHGGADLGPSGTKEAWWRLGVDPNGVADLPPSADTPFGLAPRLTVEMIATLQGLGGWRLSGSKSAQVRLLGSATPPPVAQAIGSALYAAMREK